MALGRYYQLACIPSVRLRTTDLKFLAPIFAVNETACAYIEAQSHGIFRPRSIVSPIDQLYTQIISVYTSTMNIV